MDNFIISLEVVLPLFFMMAVGYTLRRALSLDDQWIRTTNKVVFRILLPLLLFRNMMESDLTGAFTPETLGLIVFAAAGVLLTFLALYLIIPRLEPENARRGVMIQGILRSNMALFGIPVALSIYGEGNIAVVTLLVSFIVPLFNVTAVLALKLFQGGKPQWGHILRDIVTNPLILAIAAGTAFNLLHVQLPAPVQSAAWGLAGCATPISFLVLGASFTFASAAKNRRALMGVVLARLLLVPLVWLAIGALLGFRGQSMLALLMLFAPPTAVSSFPMACAMGGDADLCSEIVVFTSAFSVLSIFLWVFALKSLCWI